ncbi:MAG: hypothetical protein GY898_19680 [Proteobacteria bacterium]|nr:hypothetical protein [Pseudomonadota bacterium]
MGIGGLSTAHAQGVGEVRERADAAVRAALGDGSDKVLIEDRALGRVATWAAAQRLRGETELAHFRHRLWAEGVRDFEFLPLVITATDSDPVAALETALQDRSVRWGRYNSIAVAASRLGATTSVAVLLSRRTATFVDNGVTSPDEALLRISGDYTSPVLYVTRPDGFVERRTPYRDGDVWRADVATPFDGGWLFELMADGPTGPEVLALWPRTRSGAGPLDLSAEPAATVGLGDPPDPTEPFPPTGPVAWTPYETETSSVERSRQAPPDSAAWVQGSGAGPDRAPTAQDAKAAEDRLWELISATRAARGRPSLKRHSSVTTSARKHARELVVGPFGHETASGTALDRLGSEGLTAARATENIARAADVAQAHAALMASPSHRANLLDPLVEVGGVGVVLTREPNGRWSAMAAEVFATLLVEDGPVDWPEALADRIDARRVAAGREPLTRRDTFSAMAERAAAEMIESGVLKLTPERRKELAEEVRFHFINARNVGIDLLVTAEPRAVDQLAHVQDERYTELGAAVIRLPTRLGDHAAGSLVVVLLFVER